MCKGQLDRWHPLQHQWQSITMTMVKTIENGYIAKATPPITQEPTTTSCILLPCEDISDGSSQNHWKSESSSRNQARRLDLNNFGPWPTLTYQAWPTMTYYAYLPCLPTGLSTTCPNHKLVRLSYPQIHFTMISVQTDLILTIAAHPLDLLPVASTPLDTLATLWLVRDLKEVSCWISTNF